MKINPTMKYNTDYLHRALLQKQSENYEKYENASYFRIITELVDDGTIADYNEVLWARIKREIGQIRHNSLSGKGDYIPTPIFEETVSNMKNNANRISLLLFLMDDVINWFNNTNVGLFQKECARIISCSRNDVSISFEDDMIHKNLVKLDSIETIIDALNGQKYEDLGDFLSLKVDWYAINPEDIVPRKKLRIFISQITNIDVRLLVLYFLRDHENFYKEMPYEIMSDYHTELTLQISLVESRSKYSIAAVDNLRAEVISLRNENEALKSRIKEYDNNIELMMEDAGDKNQKIEDLRLENVQLKAIIDELELQVNSFESDFKYIHVDITDDNKRKTITQQIRNIVRLSMPEIAEHLIRLESEKIIMLPNSLDSLLNELRRMGMSNEKGYTKANLSKYLTDAKEKKYKKK